MPSLLFSDTPSAGYSGPFLLIKVVYWNTSLMIKSWSRVLHVSLQLTVTVRKNVSVEHVAKIKDTYPSISYIVLAKTE